MDDIRKGIEGLRKRVKNNEIVVVPVDKSGKLSAVSLEKYLVMGRDHTKNDSQNFLAEN